MDSFFSLFDPADSTPRIKKERQRKKKSGASVAPSLSNHNAQEMDATMSDDVWGSTKKGWHVPEESSFLCEPQFSKHVHDTADSYLDSYIDLYTDKPQTTDVAQPKESEKKKRSSGRRSRRKKKSPPKDYIPKQCLKADKLFYPEIYQDKTIADQVTLNNRQSGWSSKASVGKNVNNLQGCQQNRVEYSSECKRRTEPFDPSQADGDLVECERLLGASLPDDNALRLHALKDELYLAGECSSDALVSDSACETDDEEQGSDDEDSGDEVYGSLPPEPQLGNVEYKLQLVSPTDNKFQHLVTQLKWRLRSGGGSAVYLLGVRDCGALRGLRARALRASLCTLRKMAAALRAELRHVTSRQLAPHRAIAQVHIRKLADAQQSVELRLAVTGANEAGKSTLIGVLTQGELDNGRGSARLNMFRHLHEVQSGRTSSLSHEILGFDAQGNVVNYGCSELMTAERIGERSAKLVSFLDLAGHSKYQRTTVHGLTGYCPHYAALVVSATAGISRMTEEHLALILALDLPFFVVLTRTDLATDSPHCLLRRLRQLLNANKRYVELKLITTEAQARCFASPADTQLLDQIDPPRADTNTTNEIAVFPVSCVSGAGLNVLHAHLLALDPPLPQLRDNTRAPEEEACEFQIDEIFRSAESGPVVGGLLASGVLREGDTLLIGPLDTGEFVPIGVRSIYRNRVPCASVRAGQSASLGLSRRPARLRQGMVLLAPPHHHCAIDASNIEAENINKNNEENVKVTRLENLNVNVVENKSNIKTEKNILRNDSRNVKNDKHSKTDSNKLKAVKHNLKTDNLKLETDKLNLKTDIINLKADNNNINVENVALSEGSQHKTAKNLNKWDIKNFKRKDKNILRDLANVESSLLKQNIDQEGNLYKDDSVNRDQIPMEDPDNPRGCLYFQATVRVLRHNTGEIYPGFQATIHIGNIRQTAVIQGIMSRNSELAAGQSASVVFRFVRQPEYVRAGRKMLFRAGRETCGVGHVTQVFPMEQV